MLSQSGCTRRVPSNGNDAAHNLYWSCDEALPPVFKASADWRLTSTVPNLTPAIVERVVFTHKSGKWELTADAYRGTAIRECLTDFFAALASDDPNLPLVAYIGHDGLMDFPLPAAATAKPGPGREAIVLCCKSAEYFAPHLAAVHGKPALLTTQLMYPDGFLLRAALDGWRRQRGFRDKSRRSRNVSLFQEMSAGGHPHWKSAAQIARLRSWKTTHSALVTSNDMAIKRLAKFYDRMVEIGW